MNAYDAVAILDGFSSEPVTGAMFLEACRHIRDHGPRGLLCGNSTSDAIAHADAADALGDDDEYLETLRG